MTILQIAGAAADGGEPESKEAASMAPQSECQETPAGAGPSSAGEALAPRPEPAHDAAAKKGHSMLLSHHPSIIALSFAPKALTSKP